MARHYRDDPTAGDERPPPRQPDAAEQQAAYDALVSRATPPVPVLIRAKIGQHIEGLRLMMAAVNLIAATALILNRPGTSPAFLFLASFSVPLPVWGIAFAAVAGGLVVTAFGVNTRALEHLLAAFLWGATATGAIIGLLTGTTTSPSASLMLTALILGMAAHHALALLLRRRMARLSR